VDDYRDTEVSPITRLWQRVVLEHIKTALSEPRPNRRGSEVTSVEVQRARLFIRSRISDPTIHAAGLNPDFVRDKIGPLIDAPLDVRKAFLRKLESRGEGRRTVFGVVR
jgi:hypothetical protein